MATKGNLEVINTSPFVEKRTLGYLFVFVAFVVFNFFSRDQYEFLIAPFSVLYVGILGLYVGTKEFDRWYDLHKSRHPGEWFVILWTLVVFGLIISSVFLGKEYKVSSEAVAVYIMVLSVFAITQKSKHLHEEKEKCENSPLELLEKKELE